MWGELFKTFGIYVIFAAAITWLLRSILTQSLNKALHQFGSLYDKRLDLIPELHYHLDMMRYHALSVIAAKKQNQPISPDFLDTATEAARTLSEKYMRARLYLDVELATKLEKIVGDIVAPVMAIEFAKSDDLSTQVYSIFLNSKEDELAESIPGLLQGLEQEFRSILGSRGFQSQQSLSAHSGGSSGSSPGSADA